MPETESKSQSPYHAAALAVFVTAAAICGLIVFALAAQVLPQTDDLCRASTWPLLPNAGVGPYLRYIYLRWSGRWASVGLEVLLLSSLPVPGSYPWLMISVIAAQCLSAFICMKQFLSNTRLALGATALVASLYFAAMPNVPEGIYWLTGMIENQLPLAFAALIFAVLLSPRASGSTASKVWRTLLACVLALIVPAFHELLGGILVLALSGATVMALVLKRPSLKMWFLVAAAAWIGFLIVYLAPGNAIRMATYPNRWNYRTALQFSLGTLRSYVLPWCLDFKHWLLALLLWIDPRTGDLRRRLPGLGSPAAVAGFCFCWLSVLVAAILATTWNTGDLIAPRTLDILYGVFLAAWLVTAFLLTQWVSTFTILTTHRRMLGSAVLVVLSILILASQNPVWGFDDLLHGRVTSWHAQWNERFNQLRSTAPHGDLQVERIRQFPRSYPAWDITEDPRDWRNQCLAGPFGTASVRLSK